MKQRGFTLVELIGVIIILGLILLIATPTIRRITSEGKEDLYNVQINNIEDGLKNWAVDNNRLLPENEGESITVTLGQLKMGGYIDSELKNPKTNECFGNDMTLTITRYQKNYIYKANTDTGIKTDACDNYIKSYIILNGDAIVYVELNDAYVDAGVVAKDELGQDITSNVTTTITGSGTIIDTSVIGNKYTVTYSVTTGSNITSIKRTVIIRDSVAPILAIPENVTLDKSATSFDAMEGVSVTDNSGETIVVTVKSNISFGIPGEYTITYTAKDSSGNKVSKKRIIKIK